MQKQEILVVLDRHLSHMAWPQKIYDDGGPINPNWVVIILTLSSWLANLWFLHDGANFHLSKSCSLHSSKVQVPHPTIDGLGIVITRVQIYTTSLKNLHTQPQSSLELGKEHLWILLGQRIRRGPWRTCNVEFSKSCFLHNQLKETHFLISFESIRGQYYVKK